MSLFKIVLTVVFYSYLSTKIHEHAHLTIIKYTKNKLELHHIIDDSCISYVLPFCGRTESSIYQYLSVNSSKEIYKYIRINAISGIIAELILYFFLLKLSKYMKIIQLITIVVISMKLVIFLRSDDLKYFRKPQTFEYKQADKEWNLILLNSSFCIATATMLTVFFYKTALLF